MPCSVALRYLLTLSVFFSLAMPASARALTSPTEATHSRLEWFLRLRYGRGASMKHHWVASDSVHGNTYDLDRWVCANQPTSRGNKNRRLVAVCTRIDGAGHPEPGRIDAYLLEETDARVRVLAEGQGLEFGAFGVPGKARVVRLGKETHGLRVDWSDAGMGWDQRYTSIVVPRNRTFVVAMTVLSALHYDGSGHCTIDDNDGCERARIDVAFNLSIDQRVPGKLHYPIRIYEHGRDCGRSINRHHLLQFDAGTGTYPVDDSLLRDTCLTALEASRSTTPPLLKRPQDSTSP